MAFNKKTWKNRVSEFFNRYRVENVQTGAISKVYMNLDDGAVTQEGDVIDANTMNDLEDRIKAGFDETYKSTDGVETSIDNADYIPFYDSSAQAMKKIAVSDAEFGGGGAEVYIAGVESTPTASQAYTVGQYLVYNGFLYKVIDAIAQGDAFVIGTNISVTTVGDEITDIHNDLTASNATAGVTDVPFRFGCDDDGNFGYIINEGGADTVHPFKSGGAEIIKVGSLSGGSSQTIDCTSVSDYQSLTVDNFWFKALRHSAYGWGNGGGSGSASGNINVSYNASTGILTVTGCYIEGLGYGGGVVDGRGRSWVYGDVYIIR